jgi:hypothetical protein
MGVRVVLEVAPKRTFASALDWPGWSRGAKTEDDALQALLAYAPRYARVTKRAKVAFAAPATLRGIEVVERVEGGTSTEFGIPAAAVAGDDAEISAREIKRLLRLLRAAWATFDVTAAWNQGAQLTLGPRGGGRQVPKMMEHLRDADAGYLTQLGSRAPDTAGASVENALARLRDAFVEAATARAAGTRLADPNKVRRPWSPRYAIRRSAWHALDHAWEIEDRSGAARR